MNNLEMKLRVIQRSKRIYETIGDKEKVEELESEEEKILDSLQVL